MSHCVQVSSEARGSDRPGVRASCLPLSAGNQIWSSGRAVYEGSFFYALSHQSLKYWYQFISSHVTGLFHTWYFGTGFCIKALAFAYPMQNKTQSFRGPEAIWQCPGHSALTEGREGFVPWKWKQVPHLGWGPNSDSSTKNSQMHSQPLSETVIEKAVREY